VKGGQVSAMSRLERRICLTAFCGSCVISKPRKETGHGEF
jgi:hypothetical protein